VLTEQTDAAGNEDVAEIHGKKEEVIRRKEEGGGRREEGGESE